MGTPYEKRKNFTLIVRFIIRPIQIIGLRIRSFRKPKDESVKARFIVSADRILKGLKQERSETREMMKTFLILLTQKLPSGRQPEPEEIKAAIEQLKDVNRMAGLLVLASMPGSIVTLPVLCKLANKYGIEIMPSAFKDEQTLEQSLETIEQPLESTSALEKKEPSK